LSLNETNPDNAPKSGPMGRPSACDAVFIELRSNA